jgi:hypothetical protein
MKKLIIIVIILIAAVYLVGLRYTVKSARSTDGTYKITIINTKSGKIHKILGE